MADLLSADTVSYRVQKLRWVSPQSLFYIKTITDHTIGVLCLHLTWVKYLSFRKPGFGMNIMLELGQLATHETHRLYLVTRAKYMYIRSFM